MKSRTNKETMLLVKLFDKVARLIGLLTQADPIGKLAAEARKANLPPYAKLPHPMLLSGDLDFFSGLKLLFCMRLMVSHYLRMKKSLARDFEDAAVTVLLQKSIKAISQYGAKSFILGGGVSANKHFTTCDQWLSQLPHIL